MGSYLSAWLRFSLCVCVLIYGTGVLAMEPIEDEGLADITGAQGVQLTLRLRNNVDAAFSPLGCAGPLNPCRMGLEFSGRDGIWLMLKDFYGYLELNDVRMQSAVLPAASTFYADASRFLSQTGTSCLIAGKSLASCLPTGMQAVRVSYPLNKGVGEYSDLKVFVNIGRIALEFDDTGTTPVTPGYMRDEASGSMLGFRMADSASLNAPSRSKFMGEAYVFGF